MASLRSLVAAGGPIAVPGATDALSAKLVAAIHIEDHPGAGKHTSEPQTLRSMQERRRASARS